MSNVGLLYYEVKRQAFKGKQAYEWTRNCLRATKLKFYGPVVMVIDNAHCHSSLESAFNKPKFLGNILLRLAPYSPVFNAMENVWSAAKAKVKRDLAEKMDAILRGTTLTLNIKEH